jgi:hypothetical protein
MEIKYYKAPLAVYIIWHPGFEAGKLYAEQLYSAFCRDIEDAYASGIGIPTFFRSAVPEGSLHPIPIPYDEAEKNALIVLVEENLILDDAWNEYIADLHKDCPFTSSNRFYPVLFSKEYSSSLRFIAVSNYIKPYEKVQQAQDDTQLAQLNAAVIKSAMLHELCRFMLGHKRIDGEENTGLAASPVNLFLSHAKRDGLEHALQFKKYIDTHTQLSNFFDANDIAYGSDWSEEIMASAANSALVVFQSDEYAGREWCRLEVLTAKRNNCPIVVVNILKEGERRSFPYIGNVPTITWNGDFKRILDQVLHQVLYNVFTKQALEAAAKTYKIHNDFILASQPELFSFVNILKAQKKYDLSQVLVLYPDPPLGYEEIALLAELQPSVLFVTPTYLPLLEQQPL